MTAPRLLFLFLLSCLSLNIAQSYVIDGPSPPPSSSILSRFQNVQCKLLMTIDKTSPPPVSSDAYDDNFVAVATGSKLGLPLDIKFTSCACTDFEMNNEALLRGGSSAPPTTASPLLSLQPLNAPKFVTLSGQKSVKVNSGAYASQLSDPETKQYFFRFVLDFPESATRNDVTLPAERLYFMSSCWMEEDDTIGMARKWKEEILCRLTSLNDEIATFENDNTVGLVDRTRRFPHYMKLMKQRKKLSLQIKMLEERFPLERPLIRGPNGTVLLKDGVVAVKRVFGGKTRYHWIGTFSFKDFFYGDYDVEETTKKLCP